MCVCVNVCVLTVWCMCVCVCKCVWCVCVCVLGSVTLQNVYINLDEPRASYKLQVALPETIHLIFLSSEREAYPDHPLCTVIGVIWQLSRCAREKNESLTELSTVPVNCL